MPSLSRSLSSYGRLHRSAVPFIVRMTLVDGDNGSDNSNTDRTASSRSRSTIHLSFALFTPRTEHRTSRTRMECEKEKAKYEGTVMMFLNLFSSEFFAIRVFATCRWTSWNYNFCTGVCVCAFANVFLFIFSAIRWRRSVRVHFYIWRCPEFIVFDRMVWCALSSLSHDFVCEYNARSLS